MKKLLFLFAICSSLFLAKQVSAVTVVNVGTTTNRFSTGGASGSRTNAYVSSTSKWGVFTYNGTSCVFASSTGLVNFASSTVSGCGVGPNAAAAQQAEMTLLATPTGTLLESFAYNDTTGNPLFLRSDDNGLSWSNPPSQIATFYFNGASSMYYQTSTLSNIFYYAYLGGKNVMEATNPSSTWSTPYNFDGANSERSGILDINKVTSTPLILAVKVSRDATPQLNTFSFGATTTGGTTFGPMDNRTSSANLLANLGEAVDATGLMHILYHVTSTGWREATYDGKNYTDLGAFSIMANNDDYPTMMYDGVSLQLFWAKNNAANDFGIGWASKTASGAWAANTDLIAHDGTNRERLSASYAPGGGNIGLTWLEGTASPFPIKFTLIPAATNGGTTVTIDNQFLLACRADGTLSVSSDGTLSVK